MATHSTPDPVDVYVGRRMRTQRTLQGLSQSALAQALDLTFQQIQKYEGGTNRISAGRLFTIAQTLNVPVAYFFEDYQNSEADTINDDICSRETLELIRCYKHMPKKLQAQLRLMVRAISNSSSNHSA